MNEQKGDVTRNIAGGKFTFFQVIVKVSFSIDAVIFEHSIKDKLCFPEWNSVCES